MTQVPTVDEAVAENYRQVKAESGRSWTDMADQFDRDADALPDVHAGPYRVLASWARTQHELKVDHELNVDEPDTELDAASDTEPEQPVDPTPPRKRTATPKAPTRTS